MPVNVLDTQGTRDPFKSFYQRLPEELYTQWLVQLKRIALANGISPESWELDDKFSDGRGPRIMTLEALTILIARSDNEALKV